MQFTRAAALSALLVSSAYAASLVQVTNFGSAPTQAKMYVYRPDGTLPANPALLVAMHYCTGSANAFYTGTQYKQMADQYKFIVIYPDSPSTNTDKCWDVNTSATLTHNGGGDSLSIIRMVQYAISNYSIDTKRVFATGSSSGAMMSQVLAGSYPDVFAAIAPFAGVPFGCFAGSSYWNSACANGQSIKTAQQWGDLVRAAYPGYTGPRPRMQLWHGSADTTLSFNNHAEGIKQWTNVLGVSGTATSTQQNYVSSGWVRSFYGTVVEGIVETGQPHNLQIPANEAIKFFGLDVTTPVSSVAPPSSSPRPSSSSAPPPSSSPVPPSSSAVMPPTSVLTPSSSRPSPTSTATGAQQTHWGQCGGQGYTGPTVCQSPWTCKFSNNWYSQCL